MFNRQQTLEAAKAYEQATKEYRKRLENANSGSAKGDTVAMQNLADMIEEFRAVRDEAQKIYFEKIGE